MLSVSVLSMKILDVDHPSAILFLSRIAVGSPWDPVKGKEAG